MADDIYLSTKPAEGTRVIPNPKNIAPKMDTDNPDLPKKQYVKMDISNPTSKLIPKHPLEEHFENEGPRAPIGHGVPKSHPAIQESEN
jgi:hypothetical protein